MADLGSPLRSTYWWTQVHLFTLCLGLSGITTLNGTLVLSDVFALFYFAVVVPKFCQKAVCLRVFLIMYACDFMCDEHHDCPSDHLSRQFRQVVVDRCVWDFYVIPVLPREAIGFNATRLCSEEFVYSDNRIWVGLGFEPASFWMLGMLTTEGNLLSPHPRSSQYQVCVFPWKRNSPTLGISLGVS